MSDVLEIRTGREVSEVVERLARDMGDQRLSLPVEATVAEGEWVRFSVVLEDGTPVIEGVGRSEGAVLRGGASKKYDLHLGELSFDARNEIMYERMLIAKQASRRGDHTGTIQLADEAMVDDGLGADEAAHASPQSVPPLPPAAARDRSAPRPKAPSLPPPPQKSGTTRQPLAPPAVTKGKSVAPAARKSAAPPARRSAAPAASKPAAPPSRGPAATSKAKAADTTNTTELESETTKVDLTAPPPKAGAVRPSRLPPSISDGPYSLDVPGELVSHARRLEERLPRKLTDRDRTPKHPEAAVLKTALRIGLAALDAISDKD